MRSNTRRLSYLILAVILTLSQALTPFALAQSSNGTNPTMRGYSQTQAKAEMSWEQKMRDIPKPDLLKEYMKVLSAEPHHVGSAYDKKNAEWILAKFKEFGLNASIESFDVLFPTPKERLLEMTSPTKFTAQLKEPAIPEDPDSSDANQLPTYNAYSADGDVTAPLVYVNYGIPADYEELAKHNIDVKGKIVLARYGESWRGIKPKVAYEHGAVGCIIYSDPKDDGYYRGDVYPEGPYRPEQGVQRGSVMDMPVYPGDPLTPGIGATKDAKRLARSEAPTLMKIPVLPISYGDALPLLKALRGPVVPENWKGALPVTYHIGPGPTEVHLKLSFDWSLKTINDVIARIDGSEYPNEWIVEGNHHDGWVNGASDPISGMVTVLEEARAFGTLLKEGWRPKRTIILAAWDGEEPGLLGSTEWAEEHADELKDKAVFYINSDSNGKGQLGASGSHTLERFVNEVSRDVTDPRSNKSLADVLKQRRSEFARNEEDKKEAKTRADNRIGALGSGSDYTAFIDHLGVASLNTGFGGEGGGGVYHSIYDSFAWYTRFSDGTFEYGRALAQMNGSMAMRMADASILPFEFTDLADTLNRYADEIEKLEKQMNPPKPIDLTPMTNAIAALKESADQYESALAKASANGGAALDKKSSKDEALNKLLYTSERKLTTNDGLAGRTWFKHQIYAPGFYTGYGVKTIPAVREALEQKKWDDAQKGVQTVKDVLMSMSAQIDAATKLLQNR
ncbi:MAG TPA: transferrin receptor-like dimerization domain-containing protein [Blastocatellia bacterium]|nr:transferrin receptor-like dimerization domain-containing protein [Blastocatellia bacterium]